MAISQADFNRWVGEHAPPLYRLAYRLLGNAHEAEDVVQETFRSAWQSRRSFEKGREPRAWLASILRCRVVDRRRKPKLPELKIWDVPVERLVEAEDRLAGEFADEMQAGLNSLPAELRETLLLVVVGGLTHQEAADELKTPLGTILSRVSRARLRLREFLLAQAASVEHGESL